MFEQGARPHPPRELFRAYLSQSDIFVGLYWQSYGQISSGAEISGLEEEFELSHELPRLLYAKVPAPDREPGLEHLMARDPWRRPLIASSRAPISCSGCFATTSRLC